MPTDPELKKLLKAQNARLRRIREILGVNQVQETMPENNSKKDQLPSDSKTQSDEKE